ncbi:MAG TPA: hypothetical protein VHC22_34235 [Pirellulales bacterium]|nr:hypothetical protein [Pirellulales bacterium]
MGKNRETWIFWSAIRLSLVALKPLARAEARALRQNRPRNADFQERDPVVTRFSEEPGWPDPCSFFKNIAEVGLIEKNGMEWKLSQAAM